jgi:hypothetical protein
VLDVAMSENPRMADNGIHSSVASSLGEHANSPARTAFFSQRFGRQHGVDEMAEELRDALANCGVAGKIINMKADGNIKEEVFKWIEFASTFIAFGSKDYGEDTGNSASTHKESQYVENLKGDRKKRIIRIRMIPFDEEFNHIQARTFFGMNDMVIPWMLGTPMPPDLPAKIVEGMGLPAETETEQEIGVSQEIDQSTVVGRPDYSMNIQPQAEAESELDRSVEMNVKAEPEPEPDRQQSEAGHPDEERRTTMETLEHKCSQSLGRSLGIGDVSLECRVAGDKWKDGAARYTIVMSVLQEEVFAFTDRYNNLSDRYAHLAEIIPGCEAKFPPKRRLLGAKGKEAQRAGEFEEFFRLLLLAETAAAPGGERAWSSAGRQDKGSKGERSLQETLKAEFLTERDFNNSTIYRAGKSPEEVMPADGRPSLLRLLIIGTSTVPLRKSVSV